MISNFQFFRKFIYKVTNKYRDIIFSVTKRRKVYLYYTQTIVEIRTEFPGIDHFIQILVGSGNKPNIEF